MGEVDEGSHCEGTVSKRRWWEKGEGTVLWPKKGVDNSVEHKAPPTSVLSHNTVPSVATLDKDGSSTFVGVGSNKGWVWPMALPDVCHKQAVAC